MDTIDPFKPHLPAPTTARPLLGLTVLAVEDSRFACEALRLLCLRSGARIRRADSLRAARRHLRVYRPTVVIIDLGLPDGNGVDLIQGLSTAAPRPEVILGTSGDNFGQAEAMAAGADGFIEKPITSLGPAAPRTAHCKRLPKLWHRNAPRVSPPCPRRQFWRDWCRTA